MTRSMKLLAIFVLALGIASASTHTVTLFQPSVVNGTELKPGDYKLTLENDKATIMKGKNKVEATVKVETGSDKFGTTSVRYSSEAGKYKVREIRLGGTTTTLVFN
ncbi:MAG TPA: hypothetical protein PKJ41_01730 [Bryobacteraceae bacterium]|nr:hypothetical protein [Bryobacteraceae bacterium]HPT25223.1 hypothetical protein [Bryobacteraceae bacterium]